MRVITSCCCPKYERFGAAMQAFLKFNGGSTMICGSAFR